MHLEFPQQLNCPICMSIFKIPITTQCGHSFCRSCLINSAKTKKLCPMCRQQFQNSPQKIKQDDTLFHILQDIVALSYRPKKKQDTSFQTKGQHMLLLDVKTSQILLPYNKIPVTFQLQNPILLNKRQKFVARQQYPYNSKNICKVEYGVISRIVSINQLRHNVYECILEGKSFCTIEQDTIEQGISQTQQQYFYRTCKANQIIQTSNINPKQFNNFIFKLKQIKDPQILRQLYKQIDRNVFLHANDPLALIYSIFGLIDIEDQQKYKVLTLFDQQKRISLIKSLMQNVKNDVSYNVAGFIKIKKNNHNAYSTIAFFIIIFIVIYLVNRQNNGQL